jgi:hypothetical protein
MVNRIAVEPSSETLSTIEVTNQVVELERGNGSSLSSLYVNAIRAQAGEENPLYSGLQVRSRTFTEDCDPSADVENHSLVQSRCPPSMAAVSFSPQ